ncbi:MAG: hypothetical protein M3R58_01180 [Pseudomonadota bacterium]|nr:hypothetical protein [Pseudomonadota bacterium]
MTLVNRRGWGIITPAAFIGHGSPMNTLEDNRYTAAWRAFGLGAHPPRPLATTREGAAPLPDPRIARPEDTNT